MRVDEPRGAPTFSATVAGRPSASGSAVDQVWRAILQGLYELRYLPGQRLTEADLTREFGVSRSSVREALSRLAAEGVVTIHRHRGATVRSANWQEMSDALSLLQIMAGYAARTAADRIGSGDNLAVARRALAEVGRPTGGLAGFDLAREQNHFYRALLRLAGNSELKRLLPQLHIHNLRIQLNDAQSARVIMADYTAILQAILSANSYEAERRMRDHVGRHFELLDRVSPLSRLDTSFPD